MLRAEVVEVSPIARSKKPWFWALLGLIGVSVVFAAMFVAAIPGPRMPPVTA